MASIDVKKKYKTQMTFVQKGKDEAKKKTKLEEIGVKQAADLYTLTDKYDQKKKEGLLGIKQDFNKRSKMIKIDLNQLADVLGGAVNGGTGSSPAGDPREEEKV